MKITSGIKTTSIKWYTVSGINNSWHLMDKYESAEEAIRAAKEHNIMSVQEGWARENFIIVKHELIREYADIVNGSIFIGQTETSKTLAYVSYLGDVTPIKDIKKSLDEPTAEAI